MPNHLTATIERLALAEGDKPDRFVPVATCEEGTATCILFAMSEGIYKNHTLRAVTMRHEQEILSTVFPSGVYLAEDANYPQSAED